MRVDVPELTAAVDAVLAEIRGVRAAVEDLVRLERHRQAPATVAMSLGGASLADMPVRSSAETTVAS